MLKKQANLAQAEEEEVEATKELKAFWVEFERVQDQRDFKNEPDGRDPATQAMMKELVYWKVEKQRRGRALITKRTQIGTRGAKSAREKKDGGSSSALVGGKDDGDG